MKIFLTGITGFLGGRVANALLQLDHDVQALIRPANQKGIDHWRRQGIRVVEGDLERPHIWKHSIDPPDTVIHSAALMSNYEHLPYSKFRSVNVEGTKHVVEAACAKNPQALFIHISTVSVLGPTRSGPADEETPYETSPSKYSRSKQEAERLIRSLNNINWIILRPAQLYGEGMLYGWPETLRKIQSGNFWILGNGKARLHVTHVSDVVEGVLLALEAGSHARCQMYHLAGPCAPTIENIFDYLAQLLQSPPPRRLPYLFGALTARALRLVPQALKPPALRLIHPKTIRYFTMDHVYDIEKARRKLRYEPHIFYRDGLKRLADWFTESSTAHIPEAV